MNIYFFSSHTPDPQMVRDLGVTIKSQFKGCISDIHAQGNEIVFTETLYIGGQTIKACSAIPQNSIVIVEAPPVLQGAWLKAGIQTLLIPQMKQEIDLRGCHTFTYCGLIQVHKIQVETSPWPSRRFGNRNNNQPIFDEPAKVEENHLHPIAAGVSCDRT